ELSGSLETISSTSSKGKDDHEKQRKKEEQAKKKQEEKERKEKERKEKEEKDRLRKEQLEQKKKEKEEEKKKKDEEKRKKEEEKKMKKFFNLKGSESPVKQGTAINSYSGKEESHDLAFIKGELLYIIRFEGNPEGKWLAKNKEGKYGYVEITDVYCDGDGDDVYDEAMSNEIPEESDGEGVTEEVYECVDL
uniref:DNA ligase 1-like n=1 Tax=Saccoglossus kowalevskii TaxID=10224 RepID=A0ABM0MI96_SACKO